jgi:DegV family protein with EDD domain
LGENTTAPHSPRVFVITDSASDITQEEAVDLGIHVVPLTTTFPDGTYRDGVDIKAEDFYEKVAATDSIPSTSQPSPAEFLSAFETFLASADGIVCITISSGLSGTYQSACIARDDLPEQLRPRVHIVDSLTCSISEGLLVRVATQMRDEGKTAETIAAELERQRDKVHIVAFVDTLDYLSKGGRMPKALSAAATLLSIHPVIGTIDGKVALLGQARGPKKGQNVLTKVVRQHGGVNFAQPFRLAYSGGGRDLLERYWKENDDLHAAWHGEPPVSMLGPVIGSHSGPGAIAVAFFENA